MAHNINSKDGRDSMFYIGSEGAPWHGLGTKVNQPLTAKEALVYANLDYTVKQYPLFAQINPTDKLKSEKMVANVRTDTNEILGIVGNRYSVLQNDEAFGFFDPLVGSDEAIYHTAGVLGKGEVVWIMAQLPEYIEGPDGNPITENVVLYNSHNGSKTLSAIFTPIRVVCENTLNMAISNTKNKVTIRHSGDVKFKLEQAHKLLGLSLDYFKKIKPIFNKMHDVKVNENDVNRFSEMIFPKNEDSKNTTRVENLQANLKNSIYNSKGQDIDQTLYWLYNGGIAYLDNDKKYRNESTRLALAWFDTNFKQKVFQNTVTMFNEKTNHNLVEK